MLKAILSVLSIEARLRVTCVPPPGWSPPVHDDRYACVSSQHPHRSCGNGQLPIDDILCDELRRLVGLGSITSSKLTDPKLCRRAFESLVVNTKRPFVRGALWDYAYPDSFFALDADPLESLFAHLARHSGGSTRRGHRMPLWHLDMITHNVWDDPLYDMGVPGTGEGPYSSVPGHEFCTHTMRSCVAVPAPHPPVCRYPVLCGMLGWEAERCWNKQALKLLQSLNDSVVLVTAKGDGPLPLLPRGVIRSWFSHGAYGFGPGFNPSIHFDAPQAIPIGHAGVPSPAVLRRPSNMSRIRRLLLVNWGSTFARRTDILVCSSVLLPFATVLPVGALRHIRPAVPYHELLSRFRFVLSPPGMGWDSYRTWEILNAGAVPVIISSGSNVTDSLFDGLPVLFVHHYTAITRSLLEQTWRDFQDTTFVVKKLTARYWADRIRADAQCTS
jgi:hypothetical protein